MDQKPSVGRIVHYVEYEETDVTGGFKHYAAIITDVHKGLNLEVQKEIKEDYPDAENIGWVVSLYVFKPTGIEFKHAVAQDTERHNTWHFPERV